MRRSRGGGKKVTGLEFAFLISQAFAIIFLIAIVFMYISAKTTFEEGIEYLPITVTYDSVESYTKRDSDGDLETQYECHYIYEIDGVQYEKTEKRSSSISEGTQVEKYYNPNNPSKISGYQSAEEMLEQLGTVKVLFGCTQGIAIIFLVIIILKKRKRIVENREYEEQIRQDIAHNMEKYKNIDIMIDRNRVFRILEPLRNKVQKSRKKVERLERWVNVAVGGNVILALIYVALRLIAEKRIQKAKENLAGDEGEFYKEYKKMIAEPILGHLFQEYTYHPQQGISIDELTSFKLYKESIRQAYTEDLIEGRYKGIFYRQVDVKRQNTNRESKEFAFAGRVAVYDFNKNLNGEVLIANRGNHNIVSGGLTKIDMESVTFNSRFDTYTTNPHVAYYLLTPQFMEYMMELNVRGDFVLRIAENHIYILRNHIDGIFEPNMKHPIDIQFEIVKSYTELKEILDVIDILNLDLVTDAVNMDGLKLNI